MSRKNLIRLGQKAAENKKYTDVTVTVPKQTDSAYIWKGASIHPMQALQNIQHRTVREVLRSVVGDEAQREKTGEVLQSYFYFDVAAPKPLPTPADLLTKPQFLEERIADARTRLQKLSNVARTEDELYQRDLDTAQLPRKILQQLKDEVVALKAIVAAVPNGPQRALALQQTLDRETIRLDAIDRPDKTKLFTYAAALDDIAANVETMLQEICSIANFHVIDTFYLFRLLVKYRISSEAELTSKDKTEISGEVTGLLHNGGAPTAFITQWLTRKLVALNVALQAIDSENIFFYLKGGRALYYLMGTPEKGTNDFDTGIIINPGLPSGQWYDLFRRVHNLCLDFLRECKYETIELFETNGAGFTAYVDHVVAQPLPAPAVPPVADPAAPAVAAVPPPVPAAPAGGDAAAVDDEGDDDMPTEILAKQVADLLLKLEPLAQRTNGKAELIDIGIPRRDTWEIWETWHLKPAAEVTAGMVYPGPLYYIAEYVMMIRDAFQPGSGAAKKTPKRLLRLTDLLQSDKTDRAVAEEVTHIPGHLLPQSVKATATFGKASKLVKCVLKQFADAHLLREDPGLAHAFDAEFAQAAGDKKNAIKYPKDFKDVLADKPAQQVETADACGFVDAMAAMMEQHVADRGAFFQKNRKEFSRFVKAIYTASIFGNQAEELEIMFAITGSFAARLHAEYAKYPHMTDVEPLHLVELTVFCGAGADTDTVLDVVAPGIIAAYKSHPDTPEYFVLESHSGSVNMYWPSEEAIGKFTYRPLVIRLTVEQVETRPELSFIWGFPVLGLRDLVWSYIRASGGTEEFSARNRLRKTANALTDILTQHENPGAVAVPVPVAAAGALPLPDADAVPPLPVFDRQHDVANLPLIAQEKPNWCWAAVSLMMRQFYAGEVLTQVQLVQSALGNTADQQYALVLLNTLLAGKRGQGVVLTWAQIVAELEADQPFIFATNVHYLVATGFAENADGRILRYWDPLPTNIGAARTMSYAQYVATVQGDGATYAVLAAG